MSAILIEFEKILSGGDLRSIGKGNSVVTKIRNQKDFDDLFKCLFHKDRIIVMRTADAIEKITGLHPKFLLKHKKKVFKLCHIVKDKELKWHLALLIPRLNLGSKEFVKVWKMLIGWVKDKNNSRIVRVNSAQGLYELTKQKPVLVEEFILTLLELEKENIPSINARIKKIRKQIKSTENK